MSHPILASLVKDSSIFFVATLGAKLASMAVIPLAAYLLGAGGFASFDEFLLLNTLFTLLYLLGLDSGATVKISTTTDNQELHTIILMSMLTVAGLVFSLTLLTAFIFSIFGVTFKLPILHAACAAFFAALQLIVFTFSRSKGDSLHSGVVIFFAAVVSTLSGLLLLATDTHRSVDNLLNGIVFGQMLGAIASIYLVRRMLTFRFYKGNASVIKDLLRLSLPYVPASLSSWARKSIDRYLIAVYFDDANAQGAYALMARLAELAQVAFGVVGSAYTPLVLKNYTQEAGRRFARQILYAACACACIGSIVCMMFAASIAELLYHRDARGTYAYAAYYALLLPLTISGLLTSLLFFSGYGFLIKERSATYSLLLFASLLMQLTFSMFSIYFGFGLIGIALGSALSSAILTIAYILYSEKLYCFSYKLRYWLLPVVLLAALATYAAASACTVLTDAQTICVRKL